MELSPKQQINELVKKSNKILILSHSGIGGDALGGMLVLERVLTKEGKEVSIVSSETIDETLTFLPGIEKIKNDISGTRDFIVQIDKSKYPVEKLSYNEDEGKLNIIITPKEGQIQKEAINLLQGEFKFDLIFVLDTPDVDKIDSVYDRHTEMFFETPIVNVDHHVGNEYFGTVNMVDLTATSTCEILVSIIESMGTNNFDEDVATCLLTGIIADTSSFKNINTTPKSLTISAQMLAAGARQQEIIQHLYKTRPLNTLKLWGKVLSRLEHDKDNRFVYSYVTYDDFKETGAHIEDIRHVMDELLSSTPGADVVLLLAEHEPTKVAGKLKGINGQDVLAIAEIFGGSGQAQSAGFNILNKSLDQAVPEIIEKVREFRSAQLGRDKLEKKERPKELNIPKTEEAPKLEANNHLSQVVFEEELADEIEKLEEKIERNEQPKEIKPEVKDLFDKFVSAEVPVDNEKPLDEPKEIPAIDPIVQALESLEHETEQTSKETKANEFLIDAIIEDETENNEFTSRHPEFISGSQESDSIEEILENENNEEKIAPEIDISELQTKEDTLKALGDIMRGYQPGTGKEKPEEK